MKIKLLNSHRERLKDTIKIQIYRNRDRKLEVEGGIETKGLGVALYDVDGLEPLELYHVFAVPAKHRATTRFALGDQDITIHCAVRPEAVRDIEISTDAAAPSYPPLNRPPGVPELAGLVNEEIASLLNIWAKLQATALGDRTAADFVEKVTRINSDRLWFVPSPEMHTRLLEAEGDVFMGASGVLHELAGYGVGRSFKTRELYGKLQLTFLHRLGLPGTLVEADIDEAGGLDAHWIDWFGGAEFPDAMHAFQVLGHALTGGITNPYDVHEILAFHQELDTGYRLIV